MARWGKAGKYPPHVQEKINFFASMVEAPPHRLPGQTVSQALDVWARECAKALHREHEPDAEQELREAIARARKDGLKRRREELEK